MRSRSEKVYQCLYEEILNGDLAPNQKLHIAKLAKKYGVGLSSVREALSQLLATNLVHSSPQKGFKVVPISLEDLHDVYTTRSLVEQMALKRAIEQGDVEWEVNLVAAYHRLSTMENRMSIAKRKEYQIWEKAHRSFNLALIGACGLQHLLIIQERLYQETERYRRIWFLAGMKKHQVIRFSEKQKDIMQAALARDTSRAMELLQQHFENAQALISDYLQND